MMKEGSASFTLTYHIYFYFHNADGFWRETAPQFTGADRGGSAVDECVKAEGALAGGFRRERSELCLWRSANTPLHHFGWKSGVHWRDGTDILQNTRGQKVADEMERKWSQRLIAAVHLNETVPFDRQAERRTTKETVVLRSLLVIVRIPFSARIQHYEIHGSWTLRAKALWRTTNPRQSLYTPRARIVSYSTDLKMRLLPVWRRKKDEFDMNFFHGLLEIPDWEKDTV